MKKGKKKEKIKLRAWGRPTRKVMTMVIPSKKEKLATRAARKKELLKELEELTKDSE